MRKFKRFKQSIKDITESAVCEVLYPSAARQAKLGAAESLNFKSLYIWSGN